jgi:hypothetical protein
MFLPIKIFPSKFFNNNNFSFRGKILLAAGFYLVSIVLSIQTADLLKKTSIDMLYTYDTENVLYISIFKNNDDELKKIVTMVNTKSTIDSLKQNQPSNKFISYILPVDMYISEIPMVKPDKARNHIFNSEYSSTKFKIIFTKAKTGQNNFITSPRQILYNTLSLEPIAEIWVDLPGNKIIKMTRLEKNEVRYKNIPEPVF